MDPERRDRYEARARAIKAMAHPTRLFIIDELSRRERCVCELTEMIGADASTVSKHLSLLKAAGLVTDDKRGLKIFYRLQCPCVLEFLGCIEAMVRTAAEKQWSLAGAGRGRKPAGARARP
jgi:ArsR family transcriptional regulator